MKVEHFTDEKNWILRPIRPQRTLFQSKPRWALFTSPIGSSYSWKEWCEREDYHLGKYRIILDIDPSNLLVINGPTDVRDHIPIVTRERPQLRHFDFYKLWRSGVTGIWLTELGEQNTRFPPNHTYSLYGWDCETIAIMDTKIIWKWEIVNGEKE